MKILIITNHSYMLYRFRKELIQELMRENEVVLSMPFVGHEDDFIAMGLRCIDTAVDRRGINPKTDWKLFCTYRRLIKQEKPDMVITYSIKPNIYAGIACSLEKIPFCANVQGLGTAFQRKGLAQFVTLLYKVSLKSAKVVFFENQGNIQEFLNRRIIPKDKAVLLHGAGISLEEYPYKKFPQSECTRFLFISRIMKEKGVDELFSAMRRLHQEYGNHVVLDLVGFFDDNYEVQVNALVDAGIAVFHGFQTEPQLYYEQSDCVVLPSYHEGMSNVLLEAAATGRPVITSDIHGCKEAVIENVSGLLCEPKNADSLYEAMAHFMKLSHEEREAMGFAGRTHIELIFDKKKVVAETISALGI